tara:strand:+ start:114 stop:545 length:432 start_codon:yes stop_codon:yes gene_type:complete
MSINIVKLINGETLLTEVTHEDETHLHIIDPVQITIQNRQGAAPVCICTIWVPLTKKVNLLHLKQSTVLVKTEVDEDMIEYYNNCLEAVRESMTEDGGGSFFTSTRASNKEESLTASEITELLQKLKITNQSTNLPVANTAIH